MNELKEILESGIEITNELYNLALKEDFSAIGLKYSELSNKINQFYLTMINQNQTVSPIIIQQMEEVYDALQKGDSVKIIDIARYEMRPILQEYWEVM